VTRFLHRAIILAGLLGSIPSQSFAADLYFPPTEGEWETVETADAGFDAERLEAAASLAESMHSSGLVVLFHGRILLERHWRIEPESDHSSGTYQRMVKGYTDDGHAIEDVASVQKSVTSFLAGIAVSADQLSLDDPVSIYLPEGWSNASAEEERAITIRHLMTMTSGLTEQLNYKLPPGMEWSYNTGAYSQMVGVLQSIYSKPIEEISSERLTKRVGMRNSKWVSRGRPSGSNNVGFTTTARDLARFGLLILGNGKWDGEDLGVSQDYLETMLSSSQQLNQNYGLLWWLNGRPPNLQPGERYRSIPNAPEDVVAALGALGRIVHISRETGLVVVRLGNSAPKEFNMELWGLLMNAKTAE